MKLDMSELGAFRGDRGTPPQISPNGRKCQPGDNRAAVLVVEARSRSEEEVFDAERDEGLGAAALSWPVSGLGACTAMS
jgi:hypothetical protein